MLNPHRNPKTRGSLDTVTRPSTANSTPRSSLAATEHEEPTPTVMPSSTELFYFYAQSLEQCAKLSTGQALFDLYRVQKKWLKIYAGQFMITSGFAKTFNVGCRGCPLCDTQTVTRRRFV